MPGYKRGVVRLFDEERRSPAQDIRTDDVLDRFEDALMADEVVQPGEKQMRFLPELPAQRACFSLERLEFGADISGVGGRKDLDRRQIAVFAVLLHRVFSQRLHNGSLPTVIRAPSRADRARKPRGFDIKAGLAPRNHILRCLWWCRLHQAFE